MAEVLCSVCNHHHEQGAKCSICGHTGKGRLFELKNPHVGFQTISFVLEHGNINPNYKFSEIIRERIFVEELGCFFNEEFDAFETSSMHFIGFLGDAPICTARWRFEGEPSSGQAIIDRLGVLSTHRCRGFGKKLLEVVIENILSTFEQMGIVLKVILAIVPACTTSSAWVTFSRCNFARNSSSDDTFQIGNTKYCKVVRYY